LPGERLLMPKEVAHRAGCRITAIYNFIRDGKLATVTVADRLLIADSEAERFIREWPSRNRGVSARWREYRAWKGSAAKPTGAS
jgi:predicted site-specific integrase-resolvase